MAKGRRMENFYINEFPGVDRSEGTRVCNVRTPDIFEFVGDIIGHNPDWLMELSSPIVDARRQREMHIRRITNPKVKSIEYIFFEGYGEGKSNRAYFGVDFYLEALGKIFREYLEGNGRTEDFQEGMRKCRIYVMPETIWRNKDFPASGCPKLYEDYTFIGGQRQGDGNAIVLFYNKKSVVDDSYHKKYVDVKESAKMYKKLIEYYSSSRKYLEASGITSKSVIYDGNGNFKLK